MDTQTVSKIKTTLPNFEQSLEELTGLVETMDKGELSLEEALKQFERGVQLIRHCQTALKTAEQKVQILTQSGSDTTLEDFELPQDNESK